MFHEDYALMVNAAVNKAALLNKKPLGYILASMLAGMFIGLGILLIFSIGGYTQGTPYTKLLMGVSFGIALSLVVIAGAELFTGNNMVMFGGFLEKKVSLANMIKVWIVCYIGNWLGSILLAAIFTGSGVATDAITSFMAEAAAAKMAVPFFPLLLRGVLCNLLVCLAVWCSFRCKSESGKLIMVFWCLFAFITCGFEHSIANMTLLTAAMFEPAGAAVTLGGYFYNILTVSLGNLIAGVVFMAVPYYIISKKKED